MLRCIGLMVSIAVAGCGGGGSSCAECVCEYSGAGCSGTITNSGGSYSGGSCQSFCERNHPTNNGCPLSGSHPAACGGGSNNDVCCACLYGSSPTMATQLDVFVSDVPDDGYCMAEPCADNMPPSFVRVDSRFGTCPLLRMCDEACGCAVATAGASLRDCFNFCEPLSTSPQIGCEMVKTQFNATACSCTQF